MTVENGDVRKPYVVLTMCHCDDPDDCYDHWSVGIPVSGYKPKTGRVSMADDMTDGFNSKADAQLFADAENAARNGGPDAS